jgi:hypothetical protein
VPQDYRKRLHPAKAIGLKEKHDNTNYTIEIYMDSSKTEKGVGSGIAIFIDRS